MTDLGFGVQISTELLTLHNQLVRERFSAGDSEARVLWAAQTHRLQKDEAAIHHGKLPQRDRWLQPSDAEDSEADESDTAEPQQAHLVLEEEAVFLDQVQVDRIRALELQRVPVTTLEQQQQEREEREKAELECLVTVLHWERSGPHDPHTGLDTAFQKLQTDPQKQLRVSAGQRARALTRRIAASMQYHGRHLTGTDLDDPRAFIINLLRQLKLGKMAVGLYLVHSLVG